jgi:hypothetical protein
MRWSQWVSCGSVKDRNGAPPQKVPLISVSQMQPLTGSALRKPTPPASAPQSNSDLVSFLRAGMQSFSSSEGLNLRKQQLINMYNPNKEQIYPVSQSTLHLEPEPTFLHASFPWLAGATEELYSDTIIVRKT